MALPPGFAVVEEPEKKRGGLPPGFSVVEEPVVQTPREPLGGLDTARGAIESINQGTTLGFGDEITGGIRAGIDRLLPNYEYDFGEGVQGEEQGLRDAYRMYRDDSGDVQEQFADENPLTALGLEIGGAILSPANALRGPRALQQAAKAKPFQAMLGRAGAEGAAYGAGSAEEGEIIEGALKGTAMGVGGAAALRGLGVAGNKLIKDRIPETLGIGANFKPLNLASEGAIGDFYRDFVGRSWGGGRKILGQSAPTMGKVARTLERAAGRKAGVAKTIAREKEALASSTKKMVNDAAAPLRRQADEAANRAKSVQPRPNAEPLEQFNLRVLKDATPASYIDDVTDIGEAGFKQLDDSISSAYSDAWAGTVVPKSQMKALSKSLDSVKKELDGAGKAKVSRIQKELKRRKPLTAQQVDQVVRELIPSTGGSTQDALGAIRANLRSLLPDNQQRLLSEVDEVYPSFLAARKAGKKARNTTGEPVFDEKQLISSSSTVGGETQSVLGTAPLMRDSKTRLVETMRNKQASDASKRALQDESVVLKSAAAQAKQKAERKAKVLKRTADRAARNKSEAANTAYDVAKAEKAALKKQLPPDPEDISGLSGALSTEAFSPLRTGYRALNLLSGSTLSRGLASPKVQRALAGQTGSQRYISDLLRRTAKEREMARMGITRYLAGQAGE